MDIDFFLDNLYFWSTIIIKKWSALSERSLLCTNNSDISLRMPQNAGIISTFGVDIFNPIIRSWFYICFS